MRNEPHFGQKVATSSAKVSNRGSVSSSKSVMSCAMTPAQPQCEHQMPSTGLAEDLLAEFTRGTYLRLLKREASWLTSMCSGH